MINQNKKAREDNGFSIPNHRCWWYIDDETAECLVHNKPMKTPICEHNDNEGPCCCEESICQPKYCPLLKGDDDA